MLSEIVTKRLKGIPHFLMEIGFEPHPFQGIGKSHLQLVTATRAVTTVYGIGNGIVNNLPS